MRDEGGRMKKKGSPHPSSSSLILHPSSFILHPSSFILPPSSFIPHPSSFPPSSFPSSFTKRRIRVYNRLEFRPMRNLTAFSFLGLVAVVALWISSTPSEARFVELSYDLSIDLKTGITLPCVCDGV